MLKKKVEGAVNAQINAELWSARLYLSISVALAADCYNGLAARMRMLHNNSLQRGYRFIDYLIKQGGKVILADTTDVPVEFNGPTDACEYALIHTLRMTELIDSLSQVARQADDEATLDMLYPFIRQQTDDESQLSVVVTRMKRLHDEQGLCWFDMMVERQLSEDVTK